MSNRPVPTTLFGLTVFGAILLQSTILRLPIFRGVVPDLALVLACFASLWQGPYKAAGYGLVAGLIEDLFVGMPVGLGMAAKTGAAMAVGLGGVGFAKWHPFVPVVAVAGGTVVDMAVRLAFCSAFGRWGFALELVQRSAARQFVYNVVAGLILYYPFYRLWRRTE